MKELICMIAGMVIMKIYYILKQYKTTEMYDETDEDEYEVVSSKVKLSREQAIEVLHMLEQFNEENNEK